MRAIKGPVFLIFKTFLQSANRQDGKKIHFGYDQ